VNWSVAGSGTTATGISAAPTSANTTTGVAQVFGLASFKGQLSVRQGSPSIAEFRFEIISGGSGNQVRVVLPRSQTANLSPDQKYHFDWFADIGSSRARHIQGTATVRGNSTVFGTTLLPAQASTPIIPPSSSATWGAITGTLSDQTDLAAALSGKQPLDADLTAIAALTTTANGRALLTSANALTIGASASVSGTNTGDQDLSGYLPRLSSITVTGTTPAFPGPLVEQPALLNGRREWLGPAGSHLQFDGFDWYLGCTDGVDTYIATVNDPTDEPWKIMPPTWGISTGTGAPTLTIDPPTLVPVTPFTGTIALAADQYGRLSPTDMIGLGSYVSEALNVASNANGGFLTAGTGGTLPLTRGGTGAATASDARIALGAGTTGAELFGAADVPAANTILANNIVTKADNFTLAQTDAGTYMRLTKTGSTQTITLPTSGISAGAEFQFYRATTVSLAFSGGTVNGTANLASVPTNGAFALKHIASGTYDFI
jgi:hypothetical protein